MTATAAAYVRKSNQSDTTELSLESQERSCRDWCAEHGLELGAVYPEVQTGVDLWERAELQRLLADARAGRFALVVFHATDRLSRDPEHLTAIKVLLAACGVELACVTEPIPADATGALVSFVRGWAANREWGQLRERTLRGKRARAESGKVPGAGPDLYGYRKDRAAGVRLVDEPEAVVVREIFALAASGLPLAEICRRLNERGVPSPGRGKYARDLSRSQWGKGQLRRMLRNPAYMGEAYAWTYVYDRDRRQTVRRDPSEWIALPEGTVPAIVGADLWQRVQRRLDDNHGEWTRSLPGRRQYLLRGMLVCGICGRRLYTDLQGRSGAPIYRCSSRRSPDGPCGLGHLRAERVEPDVWERVRAFISHPAVIAQRRQERAEAPAEGLAASIAAIEQRLARLEQGQARLLRDYRRSESLPWPLVEAQIAEAEAEKAAELRQLAELRARQAAHERLTASLDELEDWCARVAERLDQMSLPERREVLALLEVRVIVHGADRWQVLPEWL